MNKITITIIAAILTCSAAAQDFIHHEFSVNIGGGASGLQTKPTLGKSNGKGAISAGLGYHYLIDQNWGIGTGINFSFYNGKIAINDYNQQHTAINTLTGNQFDFLVSSSKYQETQKVTMITIPLMAQYQYQGEEKLAYYGALGFKVGIPASSKSKSKGSFTTKGYYPNLDVTYEDLPDYGFVTNQPFPESKTNLGLKAAIMASAEFGVKYRFGETTSLYAGIYTDYGLNNTSKKGNKANNTLVAHQSDSPAQFAYNTAVNSYAKKVKPFAVGITLRFAFQLQMKQATP